MLKTCEIQIPGFLVFVVSSSLLSDFRHWKCCKKIGVSDVFLSRPFFLKSAFFKCTNFGLILCVFARSPFEVHFADLNYFGTNSVFSIIISSGLCGNVAPNFSGNFGFSGASVAQSQKSLQIASRITDASPNFPSSDVQLSDWQQFCGNVARSAWGVGDRGTRNISHVGLAPTLFR